MQRYRKWIGLGLIAAGLVVYCATWGRDPDVRALAACLSVLAVVWVLEAFAYWWFAELAWKRAWVTSLVANLASAAVGGAVAAGVLVLTPATDSGEPDVLAASLALGATLVVNVLVVWAMNASRPDRERLIEIALAANTLVLSPVWALIALFAPGGGPPSI